MNTTNITKNITNLLIGNNDDSNNDDSIILFIMILLIIGLCVLAGVLSVCQYKYKKKYVHKIRVNNIIGNI